MTLNALQTTIQRAAKAVAYQWPGVIEQDDIEQQINMHLLERPSSIEKILEMEEKAQYRAIVGVGHQLASQERTDYDHFKGSYTYSVSEVKSLLRDGILTDNPPEQFKAELLDMLEAVVVLRVSYVEALYRRYVEQTTPSNTPERHALERGLTSLTDGMNKIARNRFSERDDGIGTREIYSREQALDRIGADWDGEDDL